MDIPDLLSGFFHDRSPGAVLRALLVIPLVSQYADAPDSA
jgi:hypothetical protein